MCSAVLIGVKQLRAACDAGDPSSAWLVGGNREPTAPIEEGGMFETYLAEAAKVLAQHNESAMFAEEGVQRDRGACGGGARQRAYSGDLAEVMRPCDGCGTATSAGDRGGGGGPAVLPDVRVRRSVPSGRTPREGLVLRRSALVGGASGGDGWHVPRRGTAIARSSEKAGGRRAQQNRAADCRPQLERPRRGHRRAVQMYIPTNGQRAIGVSETLIQLQRAKSCGRIRLRRRRRWDIRPTRTKRTTASAWACAAANIGLHAAHRRVNITGAGLAGSR